MTLRAGTLKQVVTYSIYTPPTRRSALDSINKAAHMHDWWHAANIHAADERVLWTVHDDRIVLYYRQNPVAPDKLVAE